MFVFANPRWKGRKQLRHLLLGVPHLFAIEPEPIFHLLSVSRLFGERKRGTLIKDDTFPWLSISYPQFTKKKEVIVSVMICLPPLIRFFVALQCSKALIASINPDRYCHVLGWQEPVTAGNVDGTCLNRFRPRAFKNKKKNRNKKPNDCLISLR